MIRDKGWFVALLSAGRPEEVPEFVVRGYSVAHIASVLAGAAAFSRTTRRGWHHLHHRHLGQVEWKAGSDFRTARQYLVVRRNGTLILRAWPEPGAPEGWLAHTPVTAARIWPVHVGCAV